jgi:flagellar basal-body rod protein FlgB
MIYPCQHRQGKGTPVVNLDSISFFRIASQRMQWLSTRQQVISQNIANADTPGYRARDVGAFSELLDAQRSTGVRVTNAQHLTGGDVAGIRVNEDDETWGQSANGNTVVLEEQTIKSSDIAESYRLAAQLYRKAHELLTLSVTGNR